MLSNTGNPTMKKPSRGVNKQLLFSLLLLTVSVPINAQWIVQQLPVSGRVQNILFFNDNTGLLRLSDPLSLLRTSNSGKSWQIIDTGNSYYTQIKKINDSTAYSLGIYSSSNRIFQKTTNRGLNWELKFITPVELGLMSFINLDTGWIVEYLFPNQARMLRTTNACQSFDILYTAPVDPGTSLNFFPSETGIENTGYWLRSGRLYKTTNSGFNWNVLTIDSLLNGDVYYPYFLNKDTGFVTYQYNIGGDYSIYRTLNGGLNWTKQFHLGAGSYSFVNSTTGWGSYGENKIFITTNCGQSWGYQTFPIFTSGPVYMINTLTGWAGSSTDGKVAYTTNGGGVIVSIKEEKTISNFGYKLSQNYPNPFNPKTKVEFELPYRSKTTFKIYDITGKTRGIIYNNEILNPGRYELTIDFSSMQTEFSSGVYFYSLEATDISTEETTGRVFRQTKRMMLIK